MTTRIDEIEKLLKATTPGKWTNGSSGLDINCNGILMFEGHALNFDIGNIELRRNTSFLVAALKNIKREGK